MIQWYNYVVQFDSSFFFFRLHGLVSARQMEKQALSQLERRVAEERRLRTVCEAQLSAERKAKKADEAAAARAVAMATAAVK